MLIDETYFVGSISLAAGTYSNINASIEEYEPKLIESLFNYSDAKDILAYNANSEQWVKDIVEGKGYTVDDKTYKWIGLKNDKKLSAIAYYVYYWHYRTIAQITNQVGNIQAKQENGNIIGIGQKVGAAWIRMYEHLESLQMFLSNEQPERDFNISIGSVNMFDL